MSARILFSAFTLPAFTLPAFTLPAFTLPAFLLIFTFTIPAFSQDELGIPKIKKTTDHWSIGYYASGNLSIVNTYTSENSLLAGYGGLIELGYNDNRRDNLLIFGKQRYNTKNENRYIETYELSIGPRFSLNKSKSLLAELTFGGVLVSQVTQNIEYNDYSPWYYYTKTTSDFGFGLSAAIVKKFAVTENINFVPKLRLLGTLSFNKEFFLFMNLNCGVTFDNKNISSSSAGNVSYSSITLLSGVNKPEFIEQRDYLWAGSHGIEFAYKISRLIELFASGIYNNMVSIERYQPYRHYLISLSGGGRVFVNDQAVSAFIESSFGYYSYTYQYGGPTSGDSYYASKEFAGINIGTGTKFNLIKPLSLIVKANLNILFADQYKAPNYAVLHGGLRVNL